MKIVRVYFTVDDTKQFFFDLDYQEDKSNQENTDEALRFLAERMEKKAAMAVMYYSNICTKAEETQQTCPAILNFGIVSLVVITKVSVYETTKHE